MRLIIVQHSEIQTFPGEEKLSAGAPLARFVPADFREKLRNQLLRAG
ncbi:MAG: hypothetical protein AAGE37_09595 [Pseudomonadota bacterium]